MDAHEEAMLKSLVAIAWADGHLAEEEAEVIEAMLSTFHIDEDGAEFFREFARTPRSLDDVPVAELTIPERKTLLRHAVLLSHIDGGQDDQERTVLMAVVKKLALPEGEAQALIAEAEAESRDLLDL